MSVSTIWSLLATSLGRFKLTGLARGGPSGQGTRTAQVLQATSSKREDSGRSSSNHEEQPPEERNGVNSLHHPLSISVQDESLETDSTAAASESRQPARSLSKGPVAWATSALQRSLSRSKEGRERSADVAGQRVVLRLTCRDTGCGVPEEDWGLVFFAFTRVSLLPGGGRKGLLCTKTLKMGQWGRHCVVAVHL